MLGLTLAALLCLWSRGSMGQVVATYREGLFNNTYGGYQQSFVTINTPLSLMKHIGLSFRTCVGGPLFLQTSPPHYSISLQVKPEGLFFTVIINSRPIETSIIANFLDNEWHNVNIMYVQGNLSLSTSANTQLIADSSLSGEILSVTEAHLDNVYLTIGKGFTGCILQGPSIVFEQHPTTVKSYNVIWGPCPLPDTACGQEDQCMKDTCMSHGRCIPLPGTYLCQCTPRYTGNNCQVDIGPPCDRNSCKNDAKCIEDKNGDFTCICPPGFIGKDCGVEITTNLCDNPNPCENNSTCKLLPTNGGHECICLPGFSGKDCEVNINECLANPCQHGGTCIDGINSYTCHCGRTGYTGANCEQNINECENNPCQKGGTCFDNYGGYTCQCPAGFAGQNCELKMNDCASSPCNVYPNSVCVETASGFDCVCKPGYKGVVPDCVGWDLCNGKNPCRNGATCVLNGDDVTCNCPPGFTGDQFRFLKCSYKSTFEFVQLLSTSQQHSLL